MASCDNCSEKCPKAELAHEIAKGRMYATNELVTMIKKIEIGQLVEVVRCEFCLYRSQYPDKDGFYKCGGVSTDGVAMMVSPDFYCKHGERRCRDGGGTAL